MMNELKGCYTAEFSQLEAYANQVKRTNLCSSYKIELYKDKLQEGRRMFRRMFIYFQALKKGWRVGCR